MTTLELRAEIKQLLSREKNTSVLEAIRMLLRREDAETDDAVSYTHLRAHETVLDLVCRLLLEKKNT